MRSTIFSPEVDVYYVVASLLFAAFRLEKFDGSIPFDFNTWINLGQCCTGYPNNQLVNVITLELTFPLCGLILGNVIRSWLWDYAITMTVIHILLSCLVMLSFPLDWSWWVCLGFALLMMVICGETVAFVHRKKKEAQVSPKDSKAIHRALVQALNFRGVRASHQFIYVRK
ncbi:hypothetical protein ScPMuIL_006122 [Solemya velum]